MKKFILAFVVAGAAVAVLFAISFSMQGCTPAQLGAVDATLSPTPLKPTTIPSTQPGGAPVVVAPSSTDLTIHIVGAAAADAQPIAAAAPFPWNTILGLVLGAVAAGATAYGTAQSAKATSAQKATAVANAVIANAAPGVAQLVGQATDGKITDNDVTTFAQVAPGVIDLLSHPTATSSLQAVSAVAAAAATLANTPALVPVPVVPQTAPSVAAMPKV